MADRRPDGVAPGQASGDAALHRFAASRGLWGVERIGTGLEFSAYRAFTPSGRAVVLRLPVGGGRYQSNANDPLVDTRTLLSWEYRVTWHLDRLGFPVAAPVELAVADRGPDVLLSAYVPDDGRTVDSTRLGALLAGLHRLPATGLRPAAAGGEPAAAVVPRRLVRRWAEVSAVLAGPGLRWLRTGVPAAPPESVLAGQLAGRPAGSLLHLDVRRPNLRCVGGSVLALLDWSNALVGDPALELGRLTEFARLPDNGLDAGALRTGYQHAGGSWPAADDPALLVYQLDAAVMLAVVFLSESPDDVRGPLAVDRMLQVRGQLLSGI